ncbi:MAG TPA: UvrD-helicase domain-containing protein [Verrucomicrobiae bacterium]|nr:UvrD-helicase domain-containing protein [Verrucomicrobiae bacterium]
MKTTITFIGAGAGSGKTFRVTQEIQSRLVSGSCRPSGLIATTFTIKAANELSERIRQNLYLTGNLSLAERLNEASIGTVDKVCKKILTRFAFEAGISPQIEVLAEEDANLLFIQAVELSVSVKETGALQELADRLGQKDLQTRAYAWKRTVHQIANRVRENNFESADVLGMSERCWKEMLSHFPAASKDDLDAELTRTIRSALEKISQNGDNTSGTQNYCRLLEQCLSDLNNGHFAWSGWVKLTKEKPTKKSEDCAVPVMAAAAHYEIHPRLHSDIRNYIELVFQIATRSLASYQDLKAERGLADFTDLEQQTLALLENNPEITATLTTELDLVVVDEFQDTSPLQLALFLKLARCAKEVIWVGDVKQAIYGFRGTDPELTDAVVMELKNLGGVAEPLNKSYRSIPSLVNLTNAIFEVPFKQSLRLTASEVALSPVRKSFERVQPAVEFFEVSSGKMNKGGGAKRIENGPLAQTVALGVTRLLDEDYQVYDKNSRQYRAAEFRDVAVLCRTNDDAARIAEELMREGYTVSLAKSGLLQTPEALFAMACFKRLLDPSDTLATAEIIALEGKMTPEEWLENRLAYMEKARKENPNSRGARWGLEEGFVHPIVMSLEQARPALDTASVCELFDLALIAGNVFCTVTRWGPSQSRANQRRANLEALRGLAAKYEEGCATNHRPATTTGFLIWCDDLAAQELDEKAADEIADAIHVLTYHRAKGLEWPIVICTDLDNKPKSRLWDGVNVLKDDASKSFSFAEPLENRRLSFWPWPFGAQEKGIPIVEKIEQGEVGKEATRAAHAEELRLLYVGFTRARDLLVLVKEKDQPHPWLDLLGANWLRPGQNPLALPPGNTVACRTRELTPPEAVQNRVPDKEYLWFTQPSSRTPKLPAQIIPSACAPMVSAKVAEILSFGSPIQMSHKFEDDTDLGDALHAIFAAEFTHPNHPKRATTAERILKEFGCEHSVWLEDVLRAVDVFREDLEKKFKPKQILVEVPFSFRNPAGQLIAGFIDLLVQVTDGWLVIDYKSFQGQKADWEAKALGYSGQLDCYRQAMFAMNMKAESLWIYFVLGGALIRVE